MYFLTRLVTRLVFREQPETVLDNHLLNLAQGTSADAFDTQLVTTRFPFYPLHTYRPMNTTEHVQVLRGRHKSIDIPIQSSYPQNRTRTTFLTYCHDRGPCSLRPCILFLNIV